MLEKIGSQLRHLATFVPGLGAFLFAKGWLDADTAAQLDAEQVKMLAVVAGAVAVMLSRILLWVIGKYAPAFLPFLDSFGTKSPLWLITAAAGFAMAGSLLPSCSPAQVEAFKSIPITIGIEGEHGVYGYSSKSGLSVTMKTPRVREEKSATDFGAILEREWSEGRFAEPILSPHRPYRPRRVVMPWSPDCDQWSVNSQDNPFRGSGGTR